ncbi:MAG: PspC domain-containing protein [Simkaniaceae bacterium]|nr:PspC domain-containing protein [Simkaniaceae bacterium]
MRRLYRDRWNKKIAGVFGGLGVYFRVDPTILRILGVILIPLTGFFLVPIIYLIAALIMPMGPKNYIRPNCKYLYRSRRNSRIGGVCGGIAEFFNIDATLVRILTVIVMVVTAVFPVIIVYFVCMAIMPHKM